MTFYVHSLFSGFLSPPDSALLTTAMGCEHSADHITIISSPPPPLRPKPGPRPGPGYNGEWNRGNPG